MLKSAVIEWETLPNGSQRGRDTGRVEDCPCERCGAESCYNTCEGDDRNHWHGRVHTIDGGLQALCAACAKIAAGEWNERRAPAQDGAR